MKKYFLALVLLFGLVSVANANEIEKLNYLESLVKCFNYLDSQNYQLMCTPLLSQKFLIFYSPFTLLPLYLSYKHFGTSNALEDDYAVNFELIATAGLTESAKK